MEKTKSQLDVLASEELSRANGLFKQFASAHEGASVLREEVEEVQEAIIDLEESFADFWTQVRKNKGENFNFDSVDHLEFMATEVAAEAIQVMAMCKKFRGLEELKNG